ncbi:MAG: DUF2071 domain-containing protein [Paludisphaera borealis]|uniref:YqjF family protein n=1 Tax=Paludisphaera borealis TaxID=1387353 RepID=UPI0028456370|nr:DUF2071 domain-containing protein [Paludisphaera borealis]MDR3618000.1 DUF2071 domain-containing protein [Paludisphaera borealis]
MHTSGRVVMRQKWRDLLFLHWAVDPDSLRRLLPPGLDLDLFEGAAYVGLVPFTMRGVRPIGLPPVRGLSAFHETNVRTYVHLDGRDPGVWFFSLDAANRIAVRVARRLFHLPYYDARLFLERESFPSSVASSAILYGGVRRWPGFDRASYLVRAQAVGPVGPARAGTLEHFLVERYVLYAEHGGRLFQGRVRHQPYPLQSALVHAIDENLVAAAGVSRPSTAPLAHFAAGVDVDVLSLRRLRSD